jgi:hypothetical protein
MPFTTVFLLAFFGALSWVDQVAGEAAKAVHAVAPATAPLLPEETAWSMIYAEGGVLALLLAIAVFVLWKLFSKVFAETRAQNQELVATQAAAVKQLADGVARVESAVRLSDVNNTHALTRLNENLGQVIVRLDKHEARLSRHSDQIRVIEVQHKVEAETRGRRPPTDPGRA